MAERHRPLLGYHQVSDANNVGNPTRQHLFLRCDMEEIKPPTNWRNTETKKIGGIRKIADAPPIPCQHPEHNFPSMIVLEPGTYEHICPQCGARQLRQVPRIYL